MRKYLLGAAVILTALSPLFAQASASGLDPSQIKAVIGILKAFGVDQPTINKVQTVLTTGGISSPSAPNTIAPRVVSDAGATSYDGIFKVTNSNVVSDWAQHVTGLLPEQDNYASAPSFVSQTNNGFALSLPETFFNLTFDKLHVNCGDESRMSVGSDGFLYLTGIVEVNGSPQTYLCRPSGSVSGTTAAGGSINPLTPQNTAFIPGATGAHGLGSVIQYYDAPALVQLGELSKIMTVESIPSDPNNVRVTVNSSLSDNGYGVHFRRQGDVSEVISGRDYTVDQFPDTRLYMDGKTYVIDWVSNWAGQVTGMVAGNPGWTSQTNTSYPVPTMAQTISDSHSETQSTIRSRNSDILAVSTPECTTWYDGNAWRTVRHVHCSSYGMSADGRTGRGDYYDSAASAGWLQEVLGLAIKFLGLVSGVELFNGGGFLTNLTNDYTYAMNLGYSAGYVSSVTPLQAITYALSANITMVATVVASAGVQASLSQFDHGVIADIRGTSVIGTVESNLASSGAPGQEKAWSWVWSAPVPPQSAVAPTNVTLIQSAVAPLTVADPTISGQQFKISWTSQNATSCSLTKSLNGAPAIIPGQYAAGSADFKLNGSYIAALPAVGTHVYNFSCTKSGVTVYAPPITHHVQASPTASALNAFTSATSAGGTNFSYTWTRNLQIGSLYHDDVVALQTALTQGGLYSGDITGGFYNQTFSAVKAFQEKYNIDSGANAAGYVGPKTREKLNELY